MLGKDGVFLYPTFPTSAHQHNQIYHKLTDTTYMMIFNTLGMPVTNCMVGINKNKMPVGIQVTVLGNFDFQGIFLNFFIKFRLLPIQDRII